MRNHSALFTSTLFLFVISSFLLARPVPSFFYERPISGVQRYWSEDSLYCFEYAWNDSISYNKFEALGTASFFRLISPYSSDTLWYESDFQKFFGDTIIITPDGNRIVQVRWTNSNHHKITLFDTNGDTVRTYGLCDFCPDTTGAISRASLVSESQIHYWGYPVGLSANNKELLLKVIPGCGFHATPDDYHKDVRIRISDGKVLTPLLPTKFNFPIGPEPAWSKLYSDKVLGFAHNRYSAPAINYIDSVFCIGLKLGSGIRQPDSSISYCQYLQISNDGDITAQVPLSEMWHDPLVTLPLMNGCRLLLGRGYIEHDTSLTNFDLWAIMNRSGIILQEGRFPVELKIDCYATDREGNYLLFFRSYERKSKKCLLEAYKTRDDGEPIPLPLFLNESTLDSILKTLPTLLTEYRFQAVEGYHKPGSIEIKNDCWRHKYSEAMELLEGRLQSYIWRTSRHGFIFETYENKSGRMIDSSFIENMWPSDLLLSENQNLLVVEPYSCGPFYAWDVIVKEVTMSGEVIWATRYGTSTSHSNPVKMYRTPSGNILVIAMVDGRLSITSLPLPD
ncbi:hypothetical protein KKC97_08850 [bacterium]|nr:hypothetical protein [bacterium]MBU1637757.1 hypothetical protein [bacterium]